MKRKLAKLFMVLLLSAAVMAAMASPAALELIPADPPHDAPGCEGCHDAKDAGFGPGLASSVKNADLCMVCHNSPLNNWPFTNSMQAKPGFTIGISHAWNGTMPEFSDPANAYGLRNTGDLASGVLKTQLAAYDNVVTCGVCHGQHSQGNKPWDPASDTTYTMGVTNNTHFMRTDNEYNQMCEDCHYYRAMTYDPAASEAAADGIKVFSHPVSDIVNSQGYDHAVPLDTDGVAQTGAPRYAGINNNVESNLVLDATGKVRCLSCHRMHYADSNALSNSTDVRP